MTCNSLMMISHLGTEILNTIPYEKNNETGAATQFRFTDPDNFAQRAGQERSFVVLDKDSI